MLTHFLQISKLLTDGKYYEKYYYSLTALPFMGSCTAQTNVGFYNSWFNQYHVLCSYPRIVDWPETSRASVPTYITTSLRWWNYNTSVSRIQINILKIHLSYCQSNVYMKSIKISCMKFTLSKFTSKLQNQNVFPEFKISMQICIKFVYSYKRVKVVWVDHYCTLFIILDFCVMFM